MSEALPPEVWWVLFRLSREQQGSWYHVPFQLLVTAPREAFRHISGMAAQTDEVSFWLRRRRSRKQRSRFRGVYAIAYGPGPVEMDGTLPELQAAFVKVVERHG